MTILNLEDFMKEKIIKKVTVNENDLGNFYNHPVHPRDSKITSDKGISYRYLRTGRY